MNAVVVLVALLLAVPVQLLVSHYLSRNVADGEGKGTSDVRADTIDQIGEVAEDLLERLHSTANYYSTWSHLKELVLVPYRKRDKTKTIHLQTSVVKNGRGTTTILIQTDSKSDSSKGKKRSPERLQIPAKVTENDQSKAASPTSGSSAASKTSVSEGTSPAREVEDYRRDEVYFAQRKTLREKKPPTVKYSVGQVIRHKQEGYYAVIIGWDEVAKAPDEWLNTYYRNREYVISTPHYLVLVDSHFDASSMPFHYLPQEDIEIITNIQIQCPEMSKYFDGFKSGRHIPKPWLQNRYPRD